MLDGVQPGNSGVAAPDPNREQSELVARLISYAPNAAESLRTPEFARLIGPQLSQTVQESVRAAGEPGLTFDTHDGAIHLSVAMRNSRFIVRTIEARCREEGIEPQIFATTLKPTNLAEKLALTHVTFDDIGIERAEKFCARLDSALRTLQCVTDDFEPMKQSVLQVAGAINANPDLYRTGRYDPPDVAEFLKWLTRDNAANFVFLGHSRLNLDAGVLVRDPSAQQGVFRSTDQKVSDVEAEARVDAGFLLQKNQSVWVSKLSHPSPVIKEDRMMNISIAERDESGNVVAVHSVVGMLSEAGKMSQATKIPLVQQKYERLVKDLEVEDNDHYADFVRKLVDSMPKDVTLRLGVNSLREVFETAVGFQRDTETRVAIVPDIAERGAYAFVTLPQNRVGEKTLLGLQSYFESVFGAKAGSGELALDTSSFPHARAYIYVPKEGKLEFDQTAIEKDVANIVRSWEQKVLNALNSGAVHKNLNDIRLQQTFVNSCPADYKGRESIEQAALDYSRVAKLSSQEPIQVALDCENCRCETGSTISVYSSIGKIGVTRAAEIFRSLGLTVEEARAYQVSGPDGSPVQIERFKVSPAPGVNLTSSRFENTVSHGLQALFRGQGEIDPLNSLMVSADLSRRGVSLIRNLCSYLDQTRSCGSLDSIHQSLANNPQAAKLLHDMFAIRHDSNLPLNAEERTGFFKSWRDDLTALIRKIKSPAEDQVISYLSRMIESSLRTNFYVAGANGVIATKFAVRELDFIPEPRPLVECFVSSDLMYGVHLRHSLVARGGIRWSDREDLRNEVAALAATQNEKNCFIVPAGAKGGFLLRHPPEDPTERAKAGVAAYREFIGALLSITDNIETVQDGVSRARKVVHPAGIISYDASDPYLVVAADKGTAKFSDIANEIALSRNFWLGDAFASGGSKGYDHKDLGITAKGAWECVTRHFRDLGLSPDKPKTAIGIGDMSGDVFSNGVALFPMENVTLTAAFDHQHIAIFPEGAEHNALMELAQKRGSRWTDYPGELASRGGGVFERDARAISLTPAIRTFLEIPEDVDTLSGEELIQYVLKARCDLLWNGGIGTYVKSSLETDAEVKDNKNKPVRVDAMEVRALVVAEGGNNGFTQAARNEYARRGGPLGAGGRINTDAIDNSAGVGLSDLEVNYKILLAEALRDGALKPEERDELLKRLTPQAMAADLRHNREHAALLSLAEQESKQYLRYYHELIQSLEKSGIIKGGVAELPDTEEFERRREAGEGLSRPELAVCLAGAKVWLKHQLHASNILDDQVLKDYLVEYFPDELRERFQAQIDNHPLWREITATQAANSLVNSLGIHFLHKVALEHHLRPDKSDDVIGAAIAAERIINPNGLRERIGEAQGLPPEDLDKLCFSARRAHRHLTGWFVSIYKEDGPKSVSSLRTQYAGALTECIERPRKFMSPLVCDRIDRQAAELSAGGLSTGDALKLGALPEIVSASEIFRIASRVRHVDIQEAAAVYQSVLATMNVPLLRSIWEQIPHGDPSANDVYTEGIAKIRMSAASIARSMCMVAVTKQPLPETEDAVPYRKLGEQIALLRAANDDPARIWLGVGRTVSEMVERTGSSWEQLEKKIAGLSGKPTVDDIFAIGKDFERLAGSFRLERERLLPSNR